MSVAEIVALCGIVGIVFFWLGYFVAYLVDGVKCQHEWEKIYDGEDWRPFGHTVIHMCKKCGKRKITKV